MLAGGVGQGVVPLQGRQAVSCPLPVDGLEKLLPGSFGLGWASADVHENTTANDANMR